MSCQCRVSSIVCQIPNPNKIRFSLDDQSTKHQRNKAYSMILYSMVCQLNCKLICHTQYYKGVTHTFAEDVRCPQCGAKHSQVHFDWGRPICRQEVKPRCYTILKGGLFPPSPPNSTKESTCVSCCQQTHQTSKATTTTTTTETTLTPPHH